MTDQGARFALFVAAFAGMALEIVAARRFAPAIGSGIDAWAAVIATALGGFALGHVISGWLMSGQWPPGRVVTRGLFAIAAIVAVETAFAPQLLAGPTGIRVPLGYPLLVAFLGLASIATGIVGPAAARIVIERQDRPERRIATVFTLGAVGSIAGTLAAGFVLLPRLGLTAGPLAVAALPVVVCAAARQWRFAAAGAVMIAGGLASHAGAGPRPCDVVTALQCLSSRTEMENGRPVTWLVSDGVGQSTIPDRLDGPFSPYIAEALQQSLAAVAATAQPRILEIGGAGMAYSSTIARALPTSDVLTAEIDPGVTAFARRLGVPERPNHRVETTDGRVVLESSGPLFDAVLVDAFRARFVPAHMVTRQFFQALQRRLKPNAFAMVNIIDGGDRRLARAIAATAASVFPRVGLWARQDPGPLDNVVVLINATKAPEFFPARVDWSPDDRILTDQLAPVELLSP